MTKYIFSENNSGGSWWLKKPQYEALFAAGWKVDSDETTGPLASTMQGLSGDVPYAWRHELYGEFDSLRAAVESWERATGEDFFAEGCNCCGCPFSIHSEGYDESISGDSVEHTPVRPW